MRDSAETIEPSPYFAHGIQRNYNFCILLFFSQIADQKVQDTYAGGGTEILSPLRDVFAQPIPEGRSRQVFLLTDGQVGNTKDCIELTRKYSENCRVFTFGMGSSYDEELVQGIARAGFFCCLNMILNAKNP